MTATLRTAFGYVALIVTNTIVFYPLVPPAERDVYPLVLAANAVAVALALILAKNAAFLHRIRIFYALAILALVMLISVIDAYSAMDFVIHLAIALAFFAVSLFLLKPAKAF